MAIRVPAKATRDAIATLFCEDTKIPLEDDPTLAILLRGEYLQKPGLLPTQHTDNRCRQIATAFRHYAEYALSDKNRWSATHQAAAKRTLADTSRRLIALFRSSAPPDVPAQLAINALWPDARATLDHRRAECEKMCGACPPWLSLRRATDGLQADVLWVALALRQMLLELQGWTLLTHRLPDWPFRVLIDELGRVKGRQNRRLTVHQVAMLCFAAGIQNRQRCNPTFSSVYFIVREMRSRMKRWNACHPVPRSAWRPGAERLKFPAPPGWTIDPTQDPEALADLSLDRRRRT